MKEKTKKCTKCCKIKVLEDFPKSKGCRDGRRGYCKVCKSNCDKKYRDANIDVIKIKDKEYCKNNKKNKSNYDIAYCKANKDKISSRNKRMYLLNKGKIAIKTKKYREENKEKISERKKIYCIKNKSKIAIKAKKYREANKEKRKNRYHTDIGYKLAHNLRVRLNKAIKRDQKAGSAVRDLGCSVPELKKHLESQFTSGMTWNNWAYDGWHIDHIKPLASFNLEDREELLIACNYSNLQPLWAEDNLRKGDKYLD